MQVESMLKEARLALHGSEQQVPRENPIRTDLSIYLYPYISILIYVYIYMYI